MNLQWEKISASPLKIIGRLVDASNATLQAVIEDSDPLIKVIYKPIAGERPLWDFEDGNLASRELSAFIVSDVAGFEIVPFTTLRDGPFGMGMVQQWIEVDNKVDVIEFGQSDDKQLKRLALFDAVINNTDRKFGHLLLDQSGKLYGCDHGVAFHKENKLRTVLWQFAGINFDQDEIHLLGALLKIDWREKLSTYITDDEIQALCIRIQNLISDGKFPEPSQNWPAVPWPPV
ncbi:unannotated protein [freshwater metagenome]|uniref:Unannotated protein n=1 Tax=freshwater metagenome TaxID=449393 RepID=A0A6J6K1M0_9ZZZZ|nr:phosphatidylinositol kinase [Actinomycetota bacterium]